MFDAVVDTYDEATGPPWQVFAPQMLPPVVEVARRAGDRNPVEADIDVDVLDEPDYHLRINFLCVASLYFGMKNPATLERFVEAEIQDFNETAPGWRSAGLNVPATHPHGSVDAVYENCREFITTYEATVQPLPPVPAQLREALQARLGS